MNGYARRRAIAATAAAAVALVLAGTASAAGGTHTQSFTDNFHGTQTDTVVDQCTSHTIDLSETTNMVLHVTYFPSSDEVWSTFTEEDKLTAVDTVTGVTFTGHSTFWGGFNLNEQSSNSTITASVHATGSDGSSISYHEVSHFTLLPGGNVSVSFDKASVTCG
jgi:hypothetical protein